MTEMRTGFIPSPALRETGEGLATTALTHLPLTRQVPLSRMRERDKPSS